MDVAGNSVPTQQILAKLELEHVVPVVYNRSMFQPSSLELFFEISKGYGKHLFRHDDDDDDDDDFVFRHFQQDCVQ